MNGNGYCSECGKYAQTLGHLPDGTEVFRCYECGHMWAERLVVFDVSFALAEHKEMEHQPSRGDCVEVGPITSIVPRNGSSNGAEAETPES